VYVFIITEWYFINDSCIFSSSEV